jgi:hypothetical protein
MKGRSAAAAAKTPDKTIAPRGAEVSVRVLSRLLRQEHRWVLRPVGRVVLVVLLCEVARAALPAVRHH